MGHVVITGASSGIGAALARAFARRGHRVGLVARRQEPLRELAEELGQEQARWATADVADREATAAAIEQLVNELGPVDILIANAGVARLSASTRARAEVFTNTMRINYDGVVHAIDAVLPSMLERGEGRLVAVSSLASWLPVPNQGAYCASKAAVTSLMATLSAELRPRGLSVTCVHPGYVKTPLADADKGPKPFMVDADAAAEKIARGVLAGRRRVDFPAPMVAVTRMATWLPAAVYEWVAAKVMPVPDPKG